MTSLATSIDLSQLVRAIHGNIKLNYEIVRSLNRGFLLLARDGSCNKSIHVNAMKDHSKIESSLRKRYQ